MAQKEHADDSTDPVRRKLLGALGAAGIAGLAGCPGGGNGNGATTTTASGPQPGVITADAPNPDDIQEGGTLNVALTSNPSSFDPPYSSGVPSSQVQNFFYEALITQDEQGNVYPWLAQSYELVETQQIEATAYEPYMTTAPVALSEDGAPFVDTEDQIVVQHPEDTVEEGAEVRILTVNEAPDAVADGTFGMQYQYNLHEGVTFTNGEELTAQNVVDSYQRIEGSQISAQVFDTFLHAEAVDDYTVNLYAQVPDAEAERLLPQNVYPSEHIDLEGGQLDPRQGNNPIGTGPWNFESFNDSESFVVTKRDDYWLEEKGLDALEWWDGPDGFPAGPVLDEVNMQIVSEDAQRAAALQEDEVDLTWGLTPDAQTNFLESSDYEVKAVEAGGYLFMQYPVQVEPWDDKRVRQAANHLIPRQQIVDNIESGWSRPAWTPLPSLAYGTGTTDADALESDLKPQNAYDPDAAEQLINDAGVETPIEVQLETNSDNNARVRKTELIAESMNNTDLFDVNVETFEFGDFVGRILNQEYYERGNIFIVGLAGTFNPGSFCNATHHSRNWGQCCNGQRIAFDDLDQMMDNARFSSDVLGDVEERASRYDEIWREVVDLSANSYIDIDLVTTVHNNDVEAFNSYPFQQSLLSFGLYSPTSQQITYLNRS
jgi:ABC-type transport system substrate-binding protein